MDLVKAEMIARQMSGKWKAYPHDGDYYCPRFEIKSIGVGRPYAFSLIVDDYGNKGRTKVSGTYPKHFSHNTKPYGKTSPTITFASDREPKALSKDIERRFLPEYKAYYKAWEANQSRSTWDKIEKDSVVEKLIHASNGTLYKSPLYDELYSTKLYTTTETKTYPSLTATVRKDSVDMDIGSLTIEQAETLIKLLSEWLTVD